jgi:hypothetical protein
MDLGREKDLSLLSSRFNNPELPRPVRRNAERVYYKIRSQLNDRHIQRMRHQLIKAHYNKDARAAEDIGEMMLDYEYKHYGLPVRG